MTNILRPILILLWVIAVVPVDLLCIADLVMGIGLGYDVQNRSNWPQYILVLLLPAGGAIASTGLAWLSLRLWTRPKLRPVSFALALSYYAILGVIGWVVVVKHWIQ
jgi:hypothetical protein